MRDLAEIVGLEFIHISKSTAIPELREKLAMGDVIWGR
jgi:L-arabinose isomerase